jgi:H+-translocating NAD(P) transhydrogenase subunit alpha
MQIAIPAETRPGEHRVAATPETIKKLAASGHHKLLVQSGAGSGANIPDDYYKNAGAVIVPDAATLYQAAELILKVRAPQTAELKLMRPKNILVGLLDPAGHVDAYRKQGLTCFALESLPRISRAQAMDVLSSQSNIAGYKAVIMAADTYRRFFPMLMTAAGTVRPARVLILGAGVAGLQAVATAKRLGAVVEVFDVRPAVKEQVESLGAKFVEVPQVETQQMETAGGYAREMSDEYKRKQAELIQQRAVESDIIITTALIPGKPAPRLISEATLKAMKPGAVVVDMAVEAGGNCALSELDKVVERHGVTLIGLSNLSSLVAADASALYARNALNFLNLLLDAKTGLPNINRADEIIAGTLVCLDGEPLQQKAPITSGQKLKEA